MHLICEEEKGGCRENPIHGRSIFQRGVQFSDFYIHFFKTPILYGSKTLLPQFTLRKVKVEWRFKSDGLLQRNVGGIFIYRGNTSYELEGAEGSPV